MIVELLKKMGYMPEKSGSDYLRMKAIYRNSASSSLSVNTKSGWFTDFVTGQSGPLVKLAMITLNINEKDAKNFLRDEYFDGSANKTSQVYKTEKNRDRYMVLFYRAEDDFNEAKFFDDIEDAQDSAEDWVQG